MKLGGSKQLPFLYGLNKAKQVSEQQGNRSIFGKSTTYVFEWIRWHGHIQLADILKIISLLLFLIFTIFDLWYWKPKKTKGLLKFSGCIGMEHWPKMG